MMGERQESEPGERQEREMGEGQKSESGEGQDSESGEEGGSSDSDTGSASEDVDDGLQSAVHTVGTPPPPVFWTDSSQWSSDVHLVLDLMR